MAAAYSTRDMVEDYLHYKLLGKGVTWRVPPRRPSSWLSWRSGRAGTSRRRSDEVGSRCRDPRSAPPQVQVALRRAGDNLERRFHGNLSAMASALTSGDGGRRSLAAVGEELFRDGVNWGRIVAMMELGGALSGEAVKAGRAWQVDDIARWMEDSLDSAPLHRWIQDNGGWDAFVELYAESRPPVRFWWTVFGLVLLGAAGITLGVLFTRR